MIGRAVTIATGCDPSRGNERTTPHRRQGPQPADVAIPPGVMSERASDDEIQPADSDVAIPPGVMSEPGGLSILAYSGDKSCDPSRGNERTAERYRSRRRRTGRVAIPPGVMSEPDRHQKRVDDDQVAIPPGVMSERVPEHYVFSDFISLRSLQG